MQLKAASRALPPPLLPSWLHKPSSRRPSFRRHVLLSLDRTGNPLGSLQFLHAFLVQFHAATSTPKSSRQFYNSSWYSASQFATNKWLKLFSSPPLLTHVSSHVLLNRRETLELWWLRRHSTFRAGNAASVGVQRGLSVRRVSSWRGQEHEAKNGSKLHAVCILRPNYHADMINKLPLCSSDSIKITELNLESKLIGSERHGRLVKCTQYWKRTAISDLAKEVKTNLAIVWDLHMSSPS